MRHRASKSVTTLWVGVLLAGLCPAAHAFAQVETGAAEKAAVFDETARDYLSANGLLNRGLNELAAGEYRKFLSEHPNHQKANDARYGLAVALFRGQQFEEAAAELEKLRDVAGFEYAPEVAIMSGQCHLVGNRFGEAVESFAGFLEKFRDHELADDAAAGFTEASYRAEQYDAALRSSGDFIASWPQSPLRERVEFFAGLSEMASANYAAAAERFSAFLHAFPKSAVVEQVALRLAQCHQKNNDAQKAIRQYRHVLDGGSSTGAPEALFALGGLLYQVGEMEDAAKSLDRLLESFPESGLRGKAQFQRGQVHFAADEFDRALELFESAAKTEADLADRCAFWAAKCRLRQEKYADAAKRLGSAIEKFPQSALLPEMHYDRAIALIRAEKSAEAVAVLEQLQAQFGDHALAAGALHLLAAVTHRTGDYDRSSRFCRDFLARFGTHELAGAVAFLLAEDEFLSNRYESAADLYRSFLSGHGQAVEAAPARFRLAICLYRQEKFDEAEPLLAQVVAESGGDATYRPAILALGDIYFERSEWSQAESYLQKYLSAGESDAGADDALVKLAYCRQQSGRMDEALRDYDRLIESFPKSQHRLHAIFERGQALVSLKRSDEARKAFEQVLSEGGEKSKFASHALNHLGTIARTKGEHEAAAKLFARAGESAPDGAAPQLLFQQAQALLAARDFANAETALRRLLDEYPSFEKAAQAAAQIAVCLSRQDRCEETLGAIDRVDREFDGRIEPATRASMHYEKAWCLRALGRADEAADAYRTLLNEPVAEDLQFHAMLELGEMEAQAKRHEQAVEVLRSLYEKLQSESALREDAGSRADLREKCMYRLAAGEYELQKYGPAAELFRAFLSEFPQSGFAASASFFAGDSYFREGDHEQAAKHLKRVVQGFPTDSTAGPSMLRLGECLAALQRWAASEEVFAEYLSSFAGSESWYQAQFGLGWAKENQRRYDDAMREYEKVVARHQGQTAARAQFQIGQCLFAKGAYEDAVRELLKVDILYAYPQWSGAALYEAGRCFEKLGKAVEARAHFQQVLDKFKDTEWATLASRRLAELASSAGATGR